MPARRYAHAFYGIYPVGMWRRAGLMPPMWLERDFERYAYGSTISIYTPQPAKPARRAPLRHGIRVVLAGRRDPDRSIPF